MAFDDIDKRIKRYKASETERQLKLGKFIQAYRMSFPMRDNWEVDGQGAMSRDRTNLRWDTTAVQGLQSFASNIQTLLMPNFHKWARFVGAAKYDDTTKHNIDEALAPYTDILFSAIEASNLMLEANIALQDMGISVGLLQIHSTGNPREPIRFESIPMHTVSLGGFQGQIKDVYRKIKIPCRDLQATWPDAKLSYDIEQKIKSNPEEQMELLEGSIYYPENKDSEKYLYFVTDMGSKTDLVTRKQSMSRWIPFRFAVSPSEVWGDGPILQILDTIRIANKIVEMDLTNAGMKIARPLLIDAKTQFNVNNIRVEPGAQFKVKNLDPQRLPIIPLDVAGDFQFDQVTLKQYQDEIRSALFADPMGPEGGPQTSATEVSIRQRNWIKKSASSMGRLANEWLRPTILKTVVLLQEQGLLSQPFHIDPHTMEITIDGKDVDIDFLSPLAVIEDKDKIQAFMEFNQNLQATFGPELSAGMLNATEIPQGLAALGNVNPEWVKSSAELEQMQQQAAKQMAEQQQQQQAAAQQPPTDQQSVNQPAQMPPLNFSQGS